MTIPAATPPTAEQVEAILRENIMYLDYGGHSDGEMDGFPEAAAAILAALALAPAERAEAVPLRFGAGEQVVDTGTYHDVPAVFICRAKFPGDVGTSAEREGNPPSALQPGETVLTFPTTEQAKRVADALVTALAPAERAEAAPECWALYQQSDGKRLNSITFPDVGSAMQAAGCTANPVAVRGLYAEAPTRAGALDAAGATEAERPEVEHG